MTDQEARKTAGRSLGAPTRKAVRVSGDDLIKVGELEHGQPLPLVVKPSVEGVSLAGWGQSNRELIENQVLKHGGVLFRDFVVDTVADFEHFVRAIAGELFEYRERSSPRTQVVGNIYTSTDYPADQSIFLHNESSYSRTWPLRIFFHCVTPAQERGETPIADCRRVLGRISLSVREAFRAKKVMYVRNFGEGFGLPWQTVFQTTDRAEVELYCRQASIQVEWKDANRLRTRRVGPAIVRHPRTGEPVWFNHATFFHVSTLPIEIRTALMAEFDEDELPATTSYGDGSPIEPSVLDELRDAYHQETITFPWQRGDVLVLDNMLVAHGRAPFVGPRKVVVAMAQPITAEDVDTV